MRGEQREGGHVGSDGDGNSDKESELFESTNLYLSILDSWIMTVIKCTISGQIVEDRGKRYMLTNYKIFFLLPWGSCISN